MCKWLKDEHGSARLTVGLSDAQLISDSTILSPSKESHAHKCSTFFIKTDTLMVDHHVSELNPLSAEIKKNY